MGQKKVVKAVIVTTDHTYDQPIQYHCALKMMAQISGQGSVTPSPDEVSLAMAQQSQGDEPLLNEGEMRSQLLNKKAEEVLMQWWGQESSRVAEGWEEKTKLWKKDDTRKKWLAAKGTTSSKGKEAVREADTTPNRQYCRIYSYLNLGC